MTITVYMNDEPLAVDAGGTLGEVLPGWGYQGRGFVVSVNGEFVPRPAYDAHTLCDGDRVDVLKPISGG